MLFNSSLVNNKIANLFVHKQREILSDDLVSVPMADDEAVAIRNDGARDGVTVLDRDGWRGEGAEVEEDHDLGSGDKFREKLDEDRGCHIADFVEEDAETYCVRDAR